MNNDPFDSSAPERFFPASMVTEGVKENRHQIDELNDRLRGLEQAAAFHNPCHGVRAEQMVSSVGSRMGGLEVLVYTVGAALVIIMGLMVAGVVWISMDVEDRLQQVEEKVRDVRW